MCLSCCGRSTGALDSSAGAHTTRSLGCGAQRATAKRVHTHKRPHTGNRPSQTKAAAAAAKPNTCNPCRRLRTEKWPRYTAVSSRERWRRYAAGACRTASWRATKSAASKQLSATACHSRSLSDRMAANSTSGAAGCRGVAGRRGAALSMGGSGAADQVRRPEQVRRYERPAATGVQPSPDCSAPIAQSSLGEAAALHTAA